MIMSRSSMFVYAVTALLGHGAALVGVVLYFCTASLLWRRVSNWIPVTITICAGLQLLVVFGGLMFRLVGVRFMGVEHFGMLALITSGLAWPAAVALPIAVLGLARYVKRIVEIREDYEIEQGAR